MASRVAAEALGQEGVGIRKEKTWNREVFNALLAKVEEALRREVANLGDGSRIATTFAFIAFHEKGVWTAHMGDSRVYQIRPGVGIVYQSQDHSVVNALVHGGVLSPQAAIGHPRSHVITKCLSATFGHSSKGGASMCEIADVEAGDYFFLCTDGVVKCWDDQQLQELLSQPSLSDGEKMRQIAEGCRDSADNSTAYLVGVAGVTDTDTQPIGRPTQEPVPSFFSRLFHRFLLFAAVIITTICVGCGPFAVTAQSNVSVAPFVIKEKPLPAPNEAKKLAKQYRKELERGDSSHLYVLGCLYAEGVGVAANPGEALRLFALASKADKEAYEPCLRAAELCRQGIGGVAGDSATVAGWVAMAARRGHLASQHLAARNCLAAADTSSAVTFLQLAVRQGDATAMSRLGCLLDARGLYNEAVTQLRSALGRGEWGPSSCWKAITARGVLG